MKAVPSVKDFRSTRSFKPMIYMNHLKGRKYELHAPGYDKGRYKIAIADIVVARRE